MYHCLLHIIIKRFCFYATRKQTITVLRDNVLTLKKKTDDLTSSWHSGLLGTMKTQTIVLRVQSGNFVYIQRLLVFISATMWYILLSLLFSVFFLLLFWICKTHCFHWANENNSSSVFWESNSKYAHGRCVTRAKCQTRYQ